MVRKEIGLLVLGCGGVGGEEIFASWFFSTAGPIVMRCGSVDRVCGGVEGVEIGTEYGERGTAEASVEVGGRVGFDDSLVGEFKMVVVGVFGWGKEVAGVGDVTLGPSDLVHFGEVLDEVVIATKLVVDLPEVDDQGAGKVLPEGFDNGVRDIGGTDHKVVMGPAAACKFRDTKILDGLEASAKVSHALGDFAAGAVEGSTGIGPQGRINGEGEEAIGLGFFGFNAQAFDLLLGTEAAGPPLAGKGDPDSASKLG